MDLNIDSSLNFTRSNPGSVDTRPSITVVLRSRDLDPTRCLVEVSAENLWSPVKCFFPSSGVAHLEPVVLSAASIDKIPGHYTTRVFRGNELLKTNNWTLWHNQLAKDFYSGGKPLHILLFGMAGSGKSSFINSCHTFISDCVVPEIAKAGGSTGHITTTFRGIRLRSFAGLHDNNPKRTCVTFWDTWGLTRSNYMAEEFQKMVDGTLDTNFFMLKDANNQLKKERPPIDCVIFFLPMAELDNETPSKMLQRTKEFIEIATRNDVPSLVFLSLTDRVIPNFRDNGDMTGPIQTKTRNAANYFGISEGDVIPIVNYFREQQKNFVVDKVLSRALNRAAHVAIAQQNGRKFQGKDEKDLKELLDELYNP